MSSMLATGELEVPTHILVVDGHRGCRVGIQSALTELGYRVSCYRTASEALDAASVGEPLDLLITAMELPDTNALELVRRLQQLHPELRVLFLTEGPPAGPGLLPKPFSLRQLQRAVRRAL